MKLGWKELVRMKGRFSWMTIVTMLIVLLILMITGLADGLAYDNGAAVRNLPVEQFALSKDAEGQLTRSFLQADETPKGAEALGVQNMVLEKKNGTKDDVTVFALPQTTNYGPKQLQSLKKEKCSLMPRTRNNAEPVSAIRSPIFGRKRRSGLPVRSRTDVIVTHLSSG